MRKKILGASFVVAMAAIAGYNTYANQTKIEMSDMALANVEALANDNGEIKSGDPCYSNSTYNADFPKVVKCGVPCKHSPEKIPFLAEISYCL